MRATTDKRRRLPEPTPRPTPACDPAPRADGSCEGSLEGSPCLHPEAVARARAAMPPPTHVERASDLLKAVADPTRLRLLVALAATELCVCDLSAVVGISESAVSHQLRILREQHLVTFRKTGRVAYYRLLDAHVTALIQSAVDHARDDGTHPV